MNRTALAYHADCELHEGPERHPECPARTHVAYHHLAALHLVERCIGIAPLECTAERLAYVHDKDYVSSMEALLGLIVEPDMQGDIFYNRHTLRAARLAAGAAVEVVRAVALGMADNGFTLVRPPGHHADIRNPSGFCFFNNAAVAARVAQKEFGMKKVVILDWDVHHGDGTEKIFEEDPSVLCISLHQYANGKGQSVREKKVTSVDAEEALALLSDDDPGESDMGKQQQQKEEVKSTDDGGDSEELPARKKAKVDMDGEDDADDFFRRLGYIDDGSDDDYCTESSDPSPTSSRSEGDENGSDKASFYPGTGFHDHIGIGEGRGYNVNVPWPCHHFGDLEYVYIMEHLCVPMIQEFKPDIIIIAAGFDAVRGDTLGSMGLTPSGYARMTQLLMQCMQHRRVVATFEGGYNIKAVALCIEAVVRTLLGGEACGKESRVLIHRADRLMRDIGERLADTWRSVPVSRDPPLLRVHALFQGKMEVGPNKSK